MLKIKILFLKYHALTLVMWGHKVKATRSVFWMLPLNICIKKNRFVLNMITLNVIMSEVTGTL